MLPKVTLLKKRENKSYAYKEKWKNTFLIVLIGNILLAFTFCLGDRKVEQAVEVAMSRDLHISLNMLFSFQEDFTIRGFQFLGHLQQAIVMGSQNPWVWESKLWGGFDPDLNTDADSLSLYQPDTIR